MVKVSTQARLLLLYMSEELEQIKKAWQRRTPMESGHLERLGQASDNLDKAWQEYFKVLQEQYEALVGLEAK